MFIPDPNFSIPFPGRKGAGSQIRITTKNLNILNLKIVLSSGKYDPGYSSRLWIFSFPDPDPEASEAPDPISRSRNTIVSFIWSQRAEELRAFMAFFVSGGFFSRVMKAYEDA